MPPRHAYWTIIVDDQPTSFRAHDVEELLPTFNRLREKHPTAQLKWFERGQLFDTRDAAREQGFGQGERRWEGPRPERDAASAPKSDRPRDKAWRPGGEHRDPRQKYKDAKKDKWNRYKQNLRSRWEEKQEDRTARASAPPDLPPPKPDRGDHTPPHGDPIRPNLKPRRNLGAPAAMRNGGSAPPRDNWRDRPRDDRPRDDRPRDDRPRYDRPRDDRPQWGRDDRRPTGQRDDRRGPWKPKGAPRDRGRDARKPYGAPQGDRKPWSAKPAGPRKPWGGKPPTGPAKPWGAPRSPRANERESRGEETRGSKPGGARKPFGKSFGGPPRGKSSGGFRKKPFGAGPPRGPRGPKKRRDDE